MTDSDKNSSDTSQKNKEQTMRGAEKQKQKVLVGPQNEKQTKME